MFDIIILNGTLIDGTGAPPRECDVGIKNGIITTIDNLKAAEANRTIKAAGCIVCPGFIDAHTHSDTYLLIEPTSPSKLTQGITTEICGNCGASAAPISDFRHLPSDWADKTYPGHWASTADYRELLEAQGIGVNVVMQVGHNTLRRSVVGYDNRPASPDELATMVRWLEASFDAGVHGLTTGLIYAPGMFAPREELLTLASVAARYDGLYGSHMRSEGDALLDAIDETLAIGRDADVAIQISHLKVSGRQNWAKYDAALTRIHAARTAGQAIGSDRYPYTAGATDLDVVFPEWAATGDRATILKRLADASTRARLYDELIESRDRTAWEDVMVGSTTHPDNTRFRGLPLTTVAETLNLPHPVDAILHLCQTDELTTGAFFAGMSETNMRRILKAPFVMLGSDASLRALTGPLSKDYPHPRAYGTMPRFLRMVLDENLLPLPEAIRKMTSLPAAQFRLTRRGRIQTGYAADITVFNPDTLRDHASYAAPHTFAEGIKHVLVNGALVLHNGVPTRALPGQVI